MTWINFTLWLCALYTAYYAAVILTDLLKKIGTGTGGKPPVFSFEERIIPSKPRSMLNPVSAIVASGGKTLREIHSLARNEAVVYTRAVSFSR